MRHWGHQLGLPPPAFCAFMLTPKVDSSDSMVFDHFLPFTSVSWEMLKPGFRYVTDEMPAPVVVTL